MDINEKQEKTFTSSNSTLEVDLSDHALEQIPEYVRTSKNMECLDMSCNALGDFSGDFLATSCLQHLNLEQNFINQLSDSITQF